MLRASILTSRLSLAKNYILKSRYLSNANNSSDDFFTNFKRRVDEETAKEDKNLQNIHKSSQYRNLKKNVRLLINSMNRYAEETSKRGSELYSASNEYINKYKDSVDCLKSKYKIVGQSLDKINTVYEQNVKTKIPKLDPNSRIYKIGNKFYDEAAGFFFDNAPSAYTTGCSEKLRLFTQEIEHKLVTPDERTTIVHKERKGFNYLINDYLLNISWINRMRFFIRNSDNSVYCAVADSVNSTTQFIQNCFINKDSIDTYKSIYLFNPKFNKEMFLYNWENIIIPGLIDAIVTQRDMELVKKWTTPECYQLVKSSKDFFDNCKVSPVILDIYDTDIVTMKKVEKSSSSLILIRFSVIVDQNIIDPNDPTKCEKGAGYKELIVNWAIQTTPSHGDNELGFIVADFGASIASMYGYTS